MVNKYLLQLILRNTFKCLFYFTLFSSVSVFASDSNKRKIQPHVLSLATSVTDQGTYQYGIVSYETKGKGKWGMYGEMLFFSDSSQQQDCSFSASCPDVSRNDSGFSFTAGGAYGFTENLYGLAGLGFHYNKFSTAPLYNPSACDLDEPSQYCIENSAVTGSGQLGLLYITPLGLSFSGTVNTEKTLSLGIGYKF